MANQSVVQSILQSFADKVGQQTDNRVVCEIDHKEYHDFGRFQHLASYLVAENRLAPMLAVYYQPDGGFPAFIRVPALSESFSAFSEQDFRVRLETILTSPEIKKVIDEMAR